MRQLRFWLMAVVLAGLGLGSQGCFSILSLQEKPPKVMGGVREYARLWKPSYRENSWSFGILPALLCWPDLPFSLAVDVLALPYTLAKNAAHDREELRKRREEDARRLEKEAQHEQLRSLLQASPAPSCPP